MSIQNDIRTTQNNMRAVSSLVGDAVSQFVSLFQNEVDLAKAELGEKVQKATAALGFIMAGAILVIPALVMALLALSYALIAMGWSQPLSFLVSAVLALIIAGLFGAVGASRLSTHNLAPRETLRQLEKDKDAARGLI